MPAWWVRDGPRSPAQFSVLINSTTAKFVVGGSPVKIRSPQDAIRYGIGLVPEDRKQQALFLSLAVRPNLSLAALPMRWRYFVDDRAERELVESYRKALNIRFASPEQIIINLSGGNQQKVVLARWLALKPKVLIVDEPTRGIDVGAKVEVHNLLFEMAASGVAVIAISSELPEILAISDRIVTMREGRLTGEVDPEGRNRRNADENDDAQRRTGGVIIGQKLTSVAGASRQNWRNRMSDVVGETRSKLAGTDIIGILARYAPIIFLDRRHVRFHDSRLTVPVSDQPVQCDAPGLDSRACSPWV